MATPRARRRRTARHDSSVGSHTTRENDILRCWQKQGDMTFRKAIRFVVSAAALMSGLTLTLLLSTSLAGAQVTDYGAKSTGENTGDQLPSVLQRVSVAQHLNAQLPMDAGFTDETGKPVKLGDYFGKKPAILALVYYNCPMLCSEEMDGVTGALEMVHLTPGKDFNVVVISIDPSETPEMAAHSKTLNVKRYGRPETADGWHFLVGPKTSIDRTTDVVGFGYVRVPGPDGKLTQFAHASSIELVTPAGTDRAVLPGCRVLTQGRLAGLDRSFR